MSRFLPYSPDQAYLLPPSVKGELGEDHLSIFLHRPAGRRRYGRRKALVEPLLGVLKQPRNLRQFRTRGRVGVAAEFTLAAIAYNLARSFTRRLAP